jgi:hypothetical protein
MCRYATDIMTFLHERTIKKKDVMGLISFFSRGCLVIIACHLWLVRVKIEKVSGLCIIADAGKYKLYTIWWNTSHA